VIIFIILLIIQATIFLNLVICHKLLIKVEEIIMTIIIRR